MGQSGVLEKRFYRASPPPWDFRKSSAIIIAQIMTFAVRIRTKQVPTY